ncbi:putative MFS transporter [Aspergillus brunneoviolaceus CBS 621.78]|uniref:MFS general substrate transporter n=1 Tax=Aspergillus brunneoviolaceus CBS 621.78 TaxID=1450534 RepID=A0ACD1GI59_9EURO|nr:MFS general substrate transporter [Aspergillus brunneoviolaceus CBS 621.78]RAH49020.1 MFS general substrate transporter [Aspergillus brunneoviolaceus CBS 621.78]
MGLFGKKVTPSSPAEDVDAIVEAPSHDAEKQQPMHKEETHTALPQMPQTTMSIDPALEARVLRKLDLRVPTLLGFLYLLSLLDRSNIGNAKIAGMEEDLNLTGNRYSWLLTIFYISYTLFEFLALMWKIMPPHRWAAITVLSWGIVATCQAAVQNWGGLMALRFLLGMSEAAFGPGSPYLLSFFYRRHELGLRCGMFLSAAPLANTFAGALAYAITSGHAKIANWRLLFLVEGSPSLLAAILAWFYLPDHPSSARFLTEEEKEVTRARSLRRSGESERVSGIDWKELGHTLLDAKAWILAFMYFSCNVSFSSLPVFLPTILEDMGFTSINAQGLTAPPFFASFLVTIATTWVADRIQQRGLVIACASLVGAVGYVLLAACNSVGVRYLGVFLAAIGVFPSIANILPWALNNQGSDSRRGMGIVILNVIGQCGPFLGTNVFPSSDSPRYTRGLSICAAFMFFNTILALSLRVLLAWENRRLDQRYGAVAEWTAGAKDNTAVGEENYGAGFRYVFNGIRFSITDLSPPTARLLPTVYQSRAAISLYDAQFSPQTETETRTRTQTRGPIPDTTIAQVLDHLRHFQSTCSDFGVRATNIHVLATEATRTAPNAAAFCGAIRAHTGWEVRLLTKEEEGRIGALGVASSSARVAGIAMDLGGGSTQITWVVEEDGGAVRTSPRGAFSFPYGAAALGRLLREAEAEADTKSSDDGTTALGALKAEMTRQFQTAYRELEVPDSLLLGTQGEGGCQRSLYLCGGGFRGWGYVLMKTYSDKQSEGEGEAYPIPIINGFRVPRAEFHDTAAVLQEVADTNTTATTTTTKIYGVSRRRAAQIPAVAFLVNVIMDALPAEAITHIQFCQGGVREGFLYDRLPPAVRAQDPLLAATRPYAPPSADVLRDLLRAALPDTPSPRDADSFHLPQSFWATNLLAALADLLFAHAKVPRESRAAAALHSTATGILAATNCLSHVERALIALVLCERWDGELAPTDEAYQRQLVRCVSREEAWWSRYLGRVAALVGDVYPAGREPEEGRWRVRFETEWSAVVKKQGREVRDVLHLTVRRGDAATTSMLQEILTDRADGLEKVGKKKNWVHGRGVKVKVTVV